MTEHERSKEELTDSDVERLQRMIGGGSGIADGAVPALVFVIANALWSLPVAAVAAGAYGILAVGYRLIRRQAVRHALVGGVGLAISIGIALVTRDPNAYFVPGVILGGFAGLMLLLSVIIKQPSSAMFAMAVERQERSYYARPEIARLHTWITLLWAGILLGRAGLRAVLIARGETELLGASVVVLGYPLTFAAAAASIYLMRRAKKRVLGTAPESA